MELLPNELHGMQRSKGKVASDYYLRTASTDGQSRRVEDINDEVAGRELNDVR